MFTLGAREEKDSSQNELIPEKRNPSKVGTVTVVMYFCLLVTTFLEFFFCYSRKKGKESYSKATHGENIEKW